MSAPTSTPLAPGERRPAPRLSEQPPTRWQVLRTELRDWRPLDLVAYIASWIAGLTLATVAFLMLAFLAYKGLSYLTFELVTTRPQAGADQSETGGIIDPIVGTLLMVIIGIAVATPLGVGAALWVVEFGKPSWLARAVESAIEIVAGMPSIVIAIFGLALLQEPMFGFLSFTAEGGAVFGRSFMNAGVAMSLIALPLVFSSTREGLLTVPAHMREAAYALGKTKGSTIRSVLLPSIRPNIGTGMALGMGRIAGDTAIVVILLGATLRMQPIDGNVPGLDLLRGTGSTLTSYVYNNSPAGEGNAADKAYAAGFVLLLIVLALNFVVDGLLKRNADGPAK